MEGDGTTYDAAATAVANYEAAGDDIAGAPSRASVHRNPHHVQFPRLEFLEEWLGEAKQVELD